MARKVFISVLGANVYSECNYSWQGEILPPTCFIQEATLLMHKANEWPGNSAGFILLTNEARRDNWEVADGIRHTDKGEIPYIGLKERIRALNLPFEIKPIGIPKGDNNDEIWQIFETTFALLQDGDELYFDLTHGFRYLPMLVLVLGNYAKFLKKASLKSISYGNWEGRDRKTNVASITNLISLSTLQDWTFASANFLENGYSDRLANLSKEELLPLMRNSETRTIDMEQIMRLMSRLQRMTLERITCRGFYVLDSTTPNQISNQLSSINNVVIKALLPVIEKLKESVSSFTHTGDVTNMFRIAQWCHDHHLYQQAVTFLEEGVISFFCSRHNILLNDVEKREIVTSAFAIKSQDIPIEEQRLKNEEWRPILNEILEDEYLADNKLIQAVSHLVDFRNDYNHCGIRKNPLDANNVIKTTDKLIESIIRKLFPNGELRSVPASTPGKLFINLSNHPSCDWDSEQLQEASEYGQVIDIPFPKVSPEADEMEIEKIANPIINQILDYSQENLVKVHVMGEMTLTFCVVSQLKARGITCVASTTSRNVTMDSDKKISKFSFTRFRQY